MLKPKPHLNVARTLIAHGANPVMRAPS
jgi:hypothetical protein